LIIMEYEKTFTKFVWINIYYRAKNICDISIISGR